jgi:hypothetical protein
MAAIFLVMGTLLFQSFEKISRNKRDARRRSDMIALQSGLEKYHQENGYYPSDRCAVEDDSILEPILSDPVGNPKHADYEAKCSSTDYCICAKLEMTGRGNSVSGACNFQAEGIKDWFCIHHIEKT